jgi:hypothetical protein
MSGINLPRAIAVGGITAAWGYFAPVGVLNHIVTGVACAATGIFAAAVASCTKRRCEKAYRQNWSRIAPPLVIQITELEVSKAFNRLKQHPAFDLFLEIKHLNPEEALETLSGLLKGGTCTGQMAALVDIVLKKNSGVAPQDLRSIQNEEVIYLQLLYFVKSFLGKQLPNINEDDPMYQKIYKLHDLIFEKNRGLGDMNKLQYSSQFSALEKEKFPEEFRKLLMKCNGHFVGQIFINMQQEQIHSLGARAQAVGLCHVIFVHYVQKKECYLYDPLDRSSGLFRYRDQETFFAAMQERIVDKLGRDSLVCFIGEGPKALSTS